MLFLILYIKELRMEVDPYEFKEISGLKVIRNIRCYFDDNLGIHTMVFRDLFVKYLSHFYIGFFGRSFPLFIPFSKRIYLPDREYTRCLQV